MPQSTEPAFPRLRGLRLSDRVVTELEGRIVRGELAAGERLPTEGDLCALFGVSRSVIRDAVRTLKARGLVHVGPGQGIVVTDPSDEAFGQAMIVLLARSGLTMREVTEARAAIETQLGPLAAARGTVEDWRRMHERLDGFADAVELKEWSRAHSEHLGFHLALLDAIHMPALGILLKPLHETIVLSSVPPTADNAELWDVPSHPPILEALERGDADAARDALEAHFTRFLGDTRYAEFESRPFREAGIEAFERLSVAPDSIDGNQ